MEGGQTYASGRLAGALARILARRAGAKARGAAIFAVAAEIVGIARAVATRDAKCARVDVLARAAERRAALADVRRRRRRRGNDGAGADARHAGARHVAHEPVRHLKVVRVLKVERGAPVDAVAVEERKGVEQRLVDAAVVLHVGKAVDRKVARHAPRVDRERAPAAAAILRAPAAKAALRAKASQQAGIGALHVAKDAVEHCRKAGKNGDAEGGGGR